MFKIFRFFQFSLQVLFVASFLFSFLQKLCVFFNFFHNCLLHFFLLLWHEFDDFFNFLSKCCFEIVLLSFTFVETFCYFQFYLQVLFISLLLQVEKRSFRIGISQLRIIWLEEIWQQRRQLVAWNLMRRRDEKT